MARTGKPKWKTPSSFSTNSAAACRLPCAKNIRNSRAVSSEPSPSNRAAAQKPLLRLFCAPCGHRRSIFIFDRQVLALRVKIGAALQQADAAVPAQDAVVVSGRAEFFGCGKAI